MLTNFFYINRNIGDSYPEFPTILRFLVPAEVVRRAVSACESPVYLVGRLRKSTVKLQLMAKLEILHYPDPRLRKPANPVAIVDDEVRTLVDNMLETMYDAPGIGLAATQVNVDKQIIVIDISDDRSNPVCLINPRIREKSGSLETEEGCLSLPSVYEKVKRCEKVCVTALSLSGKCINIEAEGLLAVCIQHEVDHLYGTLFIDHLSRLKRHRIRRKAAKKQDTNK